MNITSPSSCLFVFLTTHAVAVTAFSCQLIRSRLTSDVALYNNVLGAGGMADTRDPKEFEDEDPRKSISAAPSFEEYMKMRQENIVTSATTVEESDEELESRKDNVAAESQEASEDAVVSFDLSQTRTINKIATEIHDLTQKSDYTWTEIIDGSTIKIDARDAVGTSNVAWLCGVYVESKMSSLTIFNGPLNDVPHFVSRCLVTAEDELHFKLDFRPRCYGGYEMAKEVGGKTVYPGPEDLGRKAFEYSGARKEFESKFGNDEVQEFLSTVKASFNGATPYDPYKSELDTLTRGPLHLSVKMPNNKANISAIIAAREAAANFWLQWSKNKEHDHRPGAPVNTQYVYDTKFKLNAYGALLEEYSGLFGENAGKKLSISESGPLDEAYVGGGS